MPDQSHRQHRRGSWRDKEDVTSFYFSRFPDEVNEKDLWQIFQRWGKVWEVFIHKAKNKAGHRFGFVRYKEIQDVQKLERQLDNSIFLGGIKMFVNQPKFARNNVNRGQLHRTLTHGKENMQEVDKGGQKTHDTGGRPRSYVEVARGVLPSVDNLSNRNVAVQGDNSLVLKPVFLTSTNEHKEWVQKAWVGRLKNRGMFERVKEELIWVLDPDINPCYWVDDWVILPNLEDDKAIHLVNEERTKGSTPLLDLQKWSPHIRPTHRLAWVLLWGLPPTVWEAVYMEKVVAELGELIEVDEMVEERRRMDVARILIRTKLRPGIAMTVTAVIDGVDVVIHIVEDMHGFGTKTKPKQSLTWYPPSPLSTEPNTPITYVARTPGVDTEGASSNGGSQGSDGGFSGRWCRSQSFLAGRVKRTQSTHDYHMAWSDADKSDVAQPHGDTKGVEDQSPKNHSNGHLRQERKILKALSHSGDCVDMQKEILPLTLKGAEDEQIEEAIAVADFDQNQKVAEEQKEDTDVALSGPTVGIMEGEKQPIAPLEEQLACSRGQVNNLGLSTPLPAGLYHFQNEVGDLGHQPTGPTNSGTKVYVRRKDFKDSKSVALSALHPPKVLDSQPHEPSSKADVKDPGTNICKQLSLEDQIALVSDMGLSYGLEAQMIKEMMLHMEQRDNSVAVQKGIKNHQ